MLGAPAPAGQPAGGFTAPCYSISHPLSPILHCRPGDPCTECAGRKFWARWSGAGADIAVVQSAREPAHDAAAAHGGACRSDSPGLSPRENKAPLLPAPAGFAAGADDAKWIGRNCDQVRVALGRRGRGGSARRAHACAHLLGFARHARGLAARAIPACEAQNTAPAAALILRMRRAVVGAAVSLRFVRASHAKWRQTLRILIKLTPPRAR